MVGSLDDSKKGTAQAVPFLLLLSFLSRRLRLARWYPSRRLKEHALNCLHHLWQFAIRSTAIVCAPSGTWGMSWGASCTQPKLVGEVIRDW
jgi:hypothetical protein